MRMAEWVPARVRALHQRAPATRQSLRATTRLANPFVARTRAKELFDDLKRAFFDLRVGVGTAVTGP